MIAITKNTDMSTLKGEKVEVLVGMSKEESDTICQVMGWSGLVTQDFVKAHTQFESQRDLIDKVLYALWSVLYHKA